MQRLAKFDQFGWWLVEHASLFGRADDKNAHVALAGRLEGHFVLLKNPIPVQVDVVETAVPFMPDCCQDDIERAMRREADMPDQPSACNRRAAARQPPGRTECHSDW